MQYEQLVDVGDSWNFVDLECCLVVVVYVMEFLIILGVLIRGCLYDVGVQIVLLGNMLLGFVDIVKDFGEICCDLVMVKFMKVFMLIIYDQSIYVVVGVGEFWEV